MMVSSKQRAKRAYAHVELKSQTTIEVLAYAQRGSMPNREIFFIHSRLISALWALNTLYFSLKRRQVALYSGVHMTSEGLDIFQLSPLMREQSLFLSVFT